MFAHADAIYVLTPEGICCQFDLRTGKYTSLVVGLLRAAAAATLLPMVGFAMIVRRKRRRQYLIQP